MEGLLVWLIVNALYVVWRTLVISNETRIGRSANA
jgi:hypothetical protein